MAQMTCLALHLLALLAKFGAAQAAVQISVASTEAVSQTQSTYASWNVDASCNRGFHHINFTNPNLVLAAGALRPSTLRFGGSGNDNLHYVLSPGRECPVPPSTECSYVTPGCLNATHWDNLYDFATASGADVLFGVSFGLEEACREGAAYVWNVSSNAAELLSYLVAAGQSVWGFELGNEVNNNGGAPCNLTAAQQAAALRAFAGVARAALPDAALVGPDTGYLGWQAWLEAYLPLAAPLGLRAVTHHVYAGVARDTFADAATLDASAPEIAWYVDAVRALAPGAQVWAGEDGPVGAGDDGTCCGDATAVCGEYASALWYADDMATRAARGFAQYQRQDFFGGAYGLTNSASGGGMALAPSDPLVLRPDYWVQFLWKRALGTLVLNATSSNAQLVRAYAFTGPPPSPFAAPECGGNDGESGSGALQLLLINLNNASDVLVELPGPRRDVGGVGSDYAAWTLSPAVDGVYSDRAMLNGAELPAFVDVSQSDPRSFLGSIPQPPVRTKVSAGVRLPPLSTSFLCIS